MLWKNFRFNLVIRTLILLGLCVFCAFLIIKTSFIVVTLLSGLAIIGVVFELLNYVERSNRDLSGFLTSIKHDDYSTTFTTSKRGRSFDEMYTELNRITNQFQQIRAEKEAQYQYLQNIVAHVEVGLLCYGIESGEVRLMNKTLQRMLRRPYVQHINGFRYLGDVFAQTLQDMQHGQQELVRLRVGNELLQLAMRATEFKLEGSPYRLISFQNIRGELEARDLEAWQQLIRILTHEIMNSVTPVVSLTSTLQEMFETDDPLEDPDLLTDTRDGLNAIRNRGLGLMRFTEAYRDLTRVPEPELELVYVDKLMGRMQTLFSTDAQNQGVEIEVDIASLKPIMADPQLIEQVLVNLLKNALEALSDQEGGRIRLTAFFESPKTYIVVEDNGPGIPDAILDRIFVPFYTTKDTGSGIGLSLSRQIMQMHKGSLSVQSAPGEGTAFYLGF